MEPKPKERIVFDEDSYYGDEGAEWAVPTSMALKRMDSLIHSIHKPRPTGLRAMTLRR